MPMSSTDQNLQVITPQLCECLGAEVIAVRTLPASLPPDRPARAYRLVLTDGRVVKVRKIEPQVDAPMVARILAAMHDPGFADLLAIVDGMLVEEWIDGAEVADPPSNDVLAQAGDLLGRLHALDRLDDVPLRHIAPTSADRQRIEHDLEVVVRAGALDAQIGQRLRAAAIACDPGAALVGACHRDFCGENMVLDQHGRLRVIDNETMAIAAFDFDLQRAAYRWRLAAEQWKVFLRAYRVHREPSLTERDTFFWRLRAVTLSAAFRVGRRLPSAAVPLAELRALSERAERFDDASVDVLAQSGKLRSKERP